MIFKWRYDNTQERTDKLKESESSTVKMICRYFQHKERNPVGRHCQKGRSIFMCCIQKGKMPLQNNCFLRTLMSLGNMKQVLQLQAHFYGAPIKAEKGTTQKQYAWVQTPSASEFSVKEWVCCANTALRQIPGSHLLTRLLPLEQFCTDIPEQLW